MPSLFYAGQPDYIEKLNTLATAASMTNGTVAASFLSLAVTGTATAASFVGPLTGNASTATALATARAINGVNFDGTAAITVTAAAGTLSGTTLAANVVNASLSSITPTGGTLGVTGDASASVVTASSRVVTDDINARTATRVSINSVSGTSIATFDHSTGLSSFNFGAAVTGVQTITANSASPALTVTNNGAGGGVALTDGTANGVAYLNGSKVLTTQPALTFEGSALTVGTSSSSYAVLVNGLASGSGGGASVIAQNGGAPIIAIGNKSSLLGGAYSATPMLFALATIEINQSLAVTGSISATTRFNLPSYTVATLPAAGAASGLIFVSDESGGAVPAFSDGTDWRRVTDRAVVS